MGLLANQYDGRTNAKYFLMPGDSHVMLDDLFTMIGPGNYPLVTFATLFINGDPGWTNVKP
jgi:hypothetical protein